MIKRYCNYYYSFEDILKILNNESKHFFDNITMANIVDNSILSSFFSITSKSHYFYNGTHANNLWQLLVERYNDEFLIKTNKELENMIEDEKKEAIYRGIKKIFIQIERTYSKYDLLLTKYASTTDFFKQIENVVEIDGSNRFNDTPQISSGYDSDTYASNFTKIENTTTSKNDGYTIMARIMEVNNNYRNVLSDWVDEFSSIFIESLNLK